MNRRAGSAVDSNDMRVVLHLAPYPALLTNARGQIVDANANAGALLGYAPHELIGLGVEALVPPEVRSLHERHRNDYDGQAARPLGHGRDLVAVRRDGVQVPIEISLQPCRVEGEHMVLCTLVDISLRQQAREALVQSERRYREITELAPDVIFRGVLEPSPRLEFVSAAIEHITGYPPAAFYEQPDLWIQLLHPDDTSRALASLARRDRFRLEARVIDRDGAIHWLAAHVVPSDSAAGAVQRFHGTARDITEQRETERKLASTEAKLLQAQKLEAVGRLAGGVAHDFNNLLTVIMSYGTFAYDDLSPSDPTRADVEQILDAARRATSLTSQLLAFSRHRTVQPQVLDIVAHLHDMTRMLARLLGEDVELMTNLAADAWPVFLDAGAFEQVVVNLAVNARDAMPRGGALTIEVANTRVERGDDAAVVEGLEPGDYVAIAVADSGCGMDGETADKVFEPFFTTKEAGRGTGLGLSTCYGIVAQAGGAIWVDSEPDKGTSFTIYLPRTERQPSRPRPPRSALPRGNGETVLVAEDSAPVRALVVRILENLGYRTLAAASGDDALLLSEHHDGPIDLLLTDVVMPHMSGKQLAERLDAVRPGLRAVYMSGYTADIIARHGVVDDGTRLLQKPFGRDDLAAVVRDALDDATA